jgi:Domain of unknown function (DUF4412)
VRLVRNVCFLISIAILSSVALHAQGIVLVEQQTRNGQSSTNQIQLDESHIRAESHASGESMVFLFDDGIQTARLLNIDQKTFIEISRDVLQQTQQQLSAVQAQLQNLPPEQRNVLEQALRARGGLPGGAQAAPKTAFRQTGSDRVGRWSCTKYEGYRGQEKVSEICTVDPKEFGATGSDFEVAKHFADFLSSSMPQISNQIIVAGNATDQGFSGIPVRRITYANGSVESSSEIKEVRREAIPASVFEVPPGFNRRTLPGR